MRKFTKSLMTLGLLLVAGVASAKVQITGGIGGLVIPGTYENIGAWGGTWSGSGVENEKDWTAYDYVWIKYSGFSGAINFGVTYSEYKSHESWGDTFYDATAPFTSSSGIVGIKLNQTSVYVKGNAAEGGAYVGDVYAKHIREVFIQATTGGSSVTLEEMWVGSAAEYFAEVIDATGFDTSKNHMLKVTNGDLKANVWDYQAQYKLSAPLTAGKTYVLDAAINAVNGGETRVVAGGEYLASKGLWANEFTRYKIEFKASAANDVIEFDLGHVAGEIYFDEVSLVEKGKTTNLIFNGDFEYPTTEGWSVSTWSGTTMQQVEKELGEIQEPGIQVTVGEAGWATFRTGSNVRISNPSVKAYAAKYMAEGNYVKLTEVTEFASWQNVLIEAPQGSYLLKSPASVTAIDDDAINDLKANGGSALPGDGTLYGLAKKNGVVGFYKVATTSEVPAWKIYLQIPTASAPDFLGFDGGTTSISELNVKSQAEGEFFNLAGQRVAQPTKGLYIVNGKKYVIK